MNADGSHGVGRSSRWCPACENFTEHEVGEDDQGVMQPAICLRCDHEHDLPPESGTQVLDAAPVGARGAYQLHDWRFRLARWYRACTPESHAFAVRNVHVSRPTAKHPRCRACVQRRSTTDRRKSNMFETKMKTGAAVDRTSKQEPQKRAPMAAAGGG